MRRRRNPSVLSMDSPVTWLVLGVGAYLLYKVWSAGSAVTGTLSTAGNAVTTAIAKAYVAATSGPAVTVAGSVVLSNGQEVPVSALTNVQPTTLPDGTASATFSYQGTNYQFTGPADETGTYYAYAT